MANLSQQKREKMLAFLESLKVQHTDDESLMALGEIERELTSKKYGLVWEEHEEKVDVKMRTHIPVFTVDANMEINGDPNSEQYNFLLEGDNLHSLRLLEKTHRGRIDVIYIDPPYNTGKKDDFTYDDQSVDSNDTFIHSKWLSFISARLRIARELISPRGVIAISIGYQEVHDLVMLCNELFDYRQVVCVTVQTSGGKPNGGFNYMQEYIVFVTPTDFVPNASSDLQTEYSSPYHAMTLANFDQVQRPNQAYPIFVDNNGHIVGCGKSLAEKIKAGEYQGEKSDYVFDYSIAPDGACAVYPVTKKGDPCVWRLISPRLLENWKKGYIKVTQQKPSDKNQNKFNIQFLADGIVKKIEAGEFQTRKVDDSTPTLEIIGFKTAGANIPTIWLDKKYYTTKGSNTITEIVGRNAFSYPKPVELIYDILQRVCNTDSLVLDFFAGSGTTGQAIMELNQQDGGQRRFILCTNNENGICENVTYQRLKTVITGKRQDGSEYSEGIPANLMYFRTDFVDKESEELSEELLAHIREMIQLEYGIKIDEQKYVTIMDDEEMDAFEQSIGTYTQLKAVFVNRDVLLSASQEKLLENIDTYTIPDYYFDFELREAGELW